MPVFLAQRWRRQPTGQAELNPNHPLISGLTGLWNFNQPFAALRNAVARELAGTSLNASFGFGVQGQAVQFTDTANKAGLKLAAVVSNLFTTTAATVALWKRKRDATNRTGRLLGGYDATNLNNYRVAALWAPYSDGVLYWGWGGTLASQSGITFSGNDRLVASVGAEMRVAMNGVRVLTNAATPTELLDGAWGLGNDPAGQVSSENADLVDFYTVATWNRQLSDFEAALWSENPWALFRPQKRPIYVNVAAAAGSVLSASGDSTATFTGKAVTNGVLSAAGDATAAFTGKALANGVLSAAGDSTASFTANSPGSGALSAPGDSTATFTGQAQAAGVLSGAGDATASFVGRANAAAVWNAAADATCAWIGNSLSGGQGTLNAAGDSSAIFVGAELAAAVLAAAGEANAAFVSLAIGGEQPETRGYRGKRRLARGLRDDADAETVRKTYDLVELKKKQAKEKRAKTEARGPQSEQAIEPRPAAPEAPAPAPSAPPETMSQKLERLEAGMAEFQELRAEVLAAREEAEVLALMAIAIAAENH